jgi:hypothetical protein
VTHAEAIHYEWYRLMSIFALTNGKGPDTLTMNSSMERELLAEIEKTALIRDERLAKAYTFMGMRVVVEKTPLTEPAYFALGMSINPNA